MSAQKSEPKPFHQSVIDFIKQADENDMLAVAGLIKLTCIPDGYAEIQAAWTERLKVLGWQSIDYGVPAYLETERRRHESAQQSGIEMT